MIGNIQLLLEGSWNKDLHIVDKTTLISTQISHIKPLPEQHEFMYGFSSIAITLNHLTKEQLARIAPTDSRLRPDQRAYEQGDVNLAASEKYRLEELQRAKRKRRNKMKLTHRPRWFELSVDEDTGEEFYKYKGGYLERRKTGQWTQEGDPELLDLFND